MDYKQAYEKFTSDAKKSQAIKVGDKVRYTGRSEWDLTSGNVYEVVNVGDDWVEVLDDVGDDYAFDLHDCKPVTDDTQAVPDYNNGEWHGWNGGECPVHPNSSIQWSRFCLGESGVAYQGACNAKHAMWDTITSFRVTKPHVEPKKPREWWIDIDTGKVFPHNDDNVDFYTVKGYVHVREVLDD